MITLTMENRRNLDQDSNIIVNQESYQYFEFIEDLSKSSNTNKYYCGRSSGLVELVELMFFNKIK